MFPISKANPNYFHYVIVPISKYPLFINYFHFYQYKFILASAIHQHTMGLIKLLFEKNHMLFLARIGPYNTVLINSMIPKINHLILYYVLN